MAEDGQSGPGVRRYCMTMNRNLGEILTPPQPPRAPFIIWTVCDIKLPESRVTRNHCQIQHFDADGYICVQYVKGASDKGDCPHYTLRQPQPAWNSLNGACSFELRPAVNVVCTGDAWTTRRDRRLCRNGCQSCVITASRSHLPICHVDRSTSNKSK